MPHGHRGGPTPAGAVDVHQSRSLRPRDIAGVGGVPTTTVTRTLIDLGVVCAPRTLTRLVDEALRRRLIVAADLGEALRRGDANGHPGSPSLRRIVEGGLTVTASAFEARLLPIFAAAGLPAPEVDVIVEGGECDFFFSQAGVCVEFDSPAFHTSGFDIRKDIAKQRRWRAAGLTVLRASTDDLDDPAGLAAEIRTAIARSERSAANAA